MEIVKKSNQGSKVVKEELKDIAKSNVIESEKATALGTSLLNSAKKVKRTKRIYLKAFGEEGASVRLYANVHRTGAVGSIVFNVREAKNNG